MSFRQLARYPEISHASNKYLESIDSSCHDDSGYFSLPADKIYND